MCLEKIERFWFRQFVNDNVFIEHEQHQGRPETVPTRKLSNISFKILVQYV